jgi:proteasome assembly chaperone 3
MSLLLEEVHPAPMQSGVGVPIKTEHFACLLDGVHTEFILNVLEDQLFFVITQLGKFGTILRARKEQSYSLEGSPIYEIDTVLGKRDDPTMEIFARQLIEITSAQCPKPLVLALGFKSKMSPKLLKSILTIIMMRRVW